jgi:hypothetical protein
MQNKARKILTSLFECLIARLAIPFLAVGLLAACSPSQFASSISTIHSLLHVIQTVLVPSIEATRAACDVRERELQARGVVDKDADADVTLRKLRADCATLNDAWLALDKARLDAQDAVESADPKRIDRALEELRKTAKQLDEVVTVTWLGSRTLNAPP